MYHWQEGERIGYGSYRHDPVLIDPEQIRDDAPASAELPFYRELMEAGHREASRLVPALRDRGVTDQVLGLFSFTRTPSRCSANRPTSKVFGSPRPFGSRMRPGLVGRSPS